MGIKQKSYYNKRNIITVVGIRVEAEEEKQKAIRLTCVQAGYENKSSG